MFQDNRVTRELTQMFMSSKNDNLYNSIKNSSYYKDFSNGKLLKDLEKSEENLISAYNNTQSLSYSLGSYIESNSILQGIITAKEVVKDIAEVTTKITPGVVDNLMFKVFDTADNVVNSFFEYFQNEYEYANQELNKAKDNMYDLMVRGMYDLQKLGEIVRDDTFYFQLGRVNKKDELEIFQINSDSMHELEKNKKLFEVSISENIDKNGKHLGTYNINFGTQMYSQNSIVNELKKIINKSTDDDNLMLDVDQAFWKEIDTTTLYSTINDKGQQNTLGRGRKFEIYTEEMYGNSGIFEQAKDKNQGYYLDNVPWLAAGDVTTNGNMSIQNKYISAKYGFGISGLSTIKEGLEFYIEAIADYGRKESDFWNKIDELRLDNDPSLQKVDGEGTTVFEQQTQQEWQEEANDMAEEEMDNLMNDFFAT